MSFWCVAISALLNRFRAGNCKAAYFQRERLAHTVGGRDGVAVHQRDMQTSGMATRKHRLMDVGEPRRDGTSSAAAAHHQHAHATAK